MLKFLVGLFVGLAITATYAETVGFELTAPVTYEPAYIYEPAYADWATWNLGNEFTLTIKSPILKKYLQDMEHKKVKLAITVVE